MMKMNLPNRLTLMRLILVPVFVAVLLISDELWANITGLAIFCIASYTDHLDGKLARKYNLITDFGKFLDPLADKFMVIGALLVILYRTLTRETNPAIFKVVFFVAVVCVVFRELAVTSMRLMVAKQGVVVAANMLGKIKTCTQIACIIVCLAEPMIYSLAGLDDLANLLPASIVLAGLMIVFTLWSGINYIVSLWKYLDQKM